MGKNGISTRSQISFGNELRSDNLSSSRIGAGGHGLIFFLLADDVSLQGLLIMIFPIDQIIKQFAKLSYKCFRFLLASLQRVLEGLC